MIRVENEFPVRRNTNQESRRIVDLGQATLQSLSRDGYVPEYFVAGEPHLHVCIVSTTDGTKTAPPASQ